MATVRQAGHSAAVPVWLLISGLLFCVQPWWSLPGLYPYDHQRWIELLTLALAAVGISAQPNLAPGGWVRRHPGHALVTLIAVILMATSAAMSSVGWISWASVLRAMLWACVLVTLPGCYRCCTDRERRSLTFAIFLIISIYSFYASLGVFVLLIHGLDQRTSMVPGFSNINHAAGFLLLALLTMPALKKRLGDDSSVFRYGWFASGSGLAFLLMEIGARGPALAGTTALAMSWILCPGVKGREYRWACLRLLMGGSLLFGLGRSWAWWADVGAVGLGAAPTFDGGRLLLYQQALAGSINAPWLGHGPLSFAARPDSPVAHPHNIVLSALYEYGLPFTIAVLVLVFSLAARLFRHRKVLAENYDAVAGLVVMSAFCIHSQLSGVAMIPATMMMLALGSMMLFQVFCEDSTATGLAPGGRLLRVLTALMCAGALLMSSAVYWSVLDDRTAQEPRFWLNGGTAQWR